MHGASLAQTVAGLLGEQLRHHLRGIAALGDEVAVAAVGAADPVLFFQVSDGPGGHRLLTDVQVDAAGDMPVGELAGNPFLEPPDADHGAVHPEQFFLFNSHSNSLLHNWGQ